MDASLISAGGIHFVLPEFVYFYRLPDSVLKTFNGWLHRLPDGIPCSLAIEAERNKVQNQNSKNKP